MTWPDRDSSEGSMCGPSSVVRRIIRIGKLGVLASKVRRPVESFGLTVKNLGENMIGPLPP